jgi:hypothetical protein
MIKKILIVYLLLSYTLLNLPLQAQNYTEQDNPETLLSRETIPVYKDFNNLKENRINLIFIFEENHSMAKKKSVIENILFTNPDIVPIKKREGVNYYTPPLFEHYPFNENVRKFNFMIWNSDKEPPIQQFCIYIYSKKRRW